MPETDGRIAELEAERMRLIAQADELRGRIAILSGRSDLARKLADKTDEYDTLKAQFDDFRDICSEHCADRNVEQIRLEDAEAALERYGNEMTRLCEAAKTFRAERDEARKLARNFHGMAWDSFDRPVSVFRQLGLDALPGWVTADSEPDTEGESSDG